MSNLDARKKFPLVAKVAAATVQSRDVQSDRLTGAHEKATLPALPLTRHLYAIGGGASAALRPDVAASRRASARRDAPSMPERLPGLSWLLQRLRALAQRVTEVRSRRRATRELERLDDRMLADIGLTRSDIPRVIWRLPTESGPRRLR